MGKEKNDFCKPLSCLNKNQNKILPSDNLVIKSNLETRFSENSTFNSLLENSLNLSKLSANYRKSFNAPTLQVL